jgi:integrase
MAMATVTKRILPSGKTRWQVGYRDRDGKRRHKMFDRKADADACETRVRAEMAAGTHVADSASVTIRQACALWLTRADTEGLEASTVRQYGEHTRLHIVPLLGDVRLSRLNAPTVEAFKDKLLESRSRAMSRAVLCSLKGVLKEAQRRGLIGHNPADAVNVREAKRDRKKPVIPSKDEIRTLIDHAASLWAPTVPWRALIVTALFTGLRSSELRGLTWEHVDVAGGFIAVRQRADYRNRMGSPKSEAGQRDIPLAPMVLNALRTWKLAAPKSAKSIVFPTRAGTPYSNSKIRSQCWLPLQVAAFGAQRYTFHALRHVAASLFIEQGWSPKKVQQVLGHSSIQMTFDTYGHLWKTAGDDLEAVAQIEARLLA